MTFTTKNRLIGRRKPHLRRRGAAAVEMALILLIFLTLVLGMLDLGIGVFRYHLVAQAARQGARQAIVHGSRADRLGPWGPDAFLGSAEDEDAHQIVRTIVRFLPTFDPAEVTLQAERIDGGNVFEGPRRDRVRVTVSAPFRPIMTFIFGNPTFTLLGTSTMPIAH